MGLLYALLELQFELVRATTPKYSHFKYIPSPTFGLKTADASIIAQQLKKHSKSAKKWTNVDIDAAASTGNFPREEAVRKLQDWNDRGAIDLQTSGVVNRFRILNPFPKTTREKESIIQKLYDHIKARERSDMERIDAVIDLITASECISRKLALHFSNEASIPTAGCGHCNFCLTRKAVPYHQTSSQFIKEAIDERKVGQILKATKVRDDARFLARVASGVSSPRVTLEKLQKHEVFGCLSGCDFEVRIVLM